MTSRGAKSGAANDMVMLDDVSERGIVNLLQKRHKADEIYTYIGPVLVSVNPYRMINGLYGPSKLKKFAGKKDYENEPHVYAVAERAYRNMLLDLSNECIVNTGESGSGKTEAAKKVMEYIAAMASKSKHVQRVKEQLLESNPLLEAFGNAKTVRNDNSSRFGKYTEILFLMGEPAGGKITVYLLEKSRVVNQQNNERNFHVFYQLLQSSSKSKYGLSGKRAEDFNYLKGGNCVQVKGIDDSQDFQNTQNAMSLVGFSSAEQDHIFSTLAGILHLGNVQISSRGRDASQAKGSALNDAAKQLKLSASAIAEALTHRTVKSGIETVTTPLDVQKATFARDSLAKSLYGALFDWIVKRLNTTIHCDSHSTSISVLDIYGFEILATNGFEQMCINYTNEKLHQMFIQLTLKAEQDEYRTEGIAWQPVSFYNNQPICDLIEKRGGIISLLDEEAIFPQGSDESLYRKMTSNLRQKEFEKPLRSKSEFSIRHYAGVVTYETTGMLDSNKDTLFPNLVLLMTRSGNNVVQALFKDHAHANPAQRSNKRPETAGTQYKKQVNLLMNNLKACNQHYIRCIKPNETKRSGMFDGELVTTQVKYLGLLENVVVRRAGFAFRQSFASFVSKYKCVAKSWNEWEPNTRRATESILRGVGTTDYQMGKTKVFIKAPTTVFAIEDRRKAFLERAATMVPPEDGLVYADKVFGFNEKFIRSPLTFVVGGLGFYWFNKDGTAAQFFPMDRIEQISYNEQEGWITFHSSYPGKGPEDPPVQLSYLSENVYTTEVKQWMEALKQMGETHIHLAASNSYSQDACDPVMYKEQLKMINKREAPSGVGGVGVSSDSSCACKCSIM